MAILRTILLSLLVLAFVLALVAVIALPVIIAFRRRHRHRWPITVLAILGCATGVLWVAALAWSLTPKNETDASEERIPLRDDRMEADGAAVLLGDRRPVSTRLLIGIVLLPPVFSWFTLRRGYSTTVRVASIGYALLSVAIIAACAYGMAEFLYGLRGDAERSRADAKYAVDNARYMTTTPDEVLAVLEAGRDDALRRRVLLIDGTIVSMRPQSGHTEIVVRGERGGELTMNGDYLVGLQPGSQVTAACAMIMRIGPVVRLPRCMVAPVNQMPVPAGADVVRGVAPEPVPEPPADRTRIPAPPNAPANAPTPFPIEDASGVTTVRNPFN